jgi:hypothetical protein
MILRRLLLFLALAFAVAACAAVMPAGPAVTTETSEFRVEAYRDVRGGRPVAVGYVYNKWTLLATHVQLRVETLDAAGAVTATAGRFLDRDINPNDRVYFEVTPGADGPAYRVTVTYVSWQPGGGGAGGGM